MTVAQAFAGAADYDRYAKVQGRVAEGLAHRIAALPLPPAPRVLEVGCGTGLLGAALVDHLPHARWLMTDIAPAMVERTQHRFADRPGMAFAVLDAEAPGTAGPFDLICSSLAAQWFEDLPGTIGRLRALLAPDGWLAFTTLAAGSFEEWQRAHDELPSGLRDYPDEQALAAMAVDVQIDTHVICHNDARDFLRTVKAIGAGTPRAGHRPLSPAHIRRVMARLNESGATATYVVATCLAGQPR